MALVAITARHLWTAVVIAGLVAISALTAIAARWSVIQVNDAIWRETAVNWVAPGGATLRPGPVTFRYDQKSGRLLYRGNMSDEQKKVIDGLFPENLQFTGAADSYHSAVQELAYTSAISPSGLLIKLLLLGGLAGVLGVQLRSFTNLVGHACYKNDLDLKRWWPYYIARPFSGFILGLAVVIVVQAGLIMTSKGQTGTLWWVSVAFLAGFGEEEFTQRLRLLTKTLFGERGSSGQGQ